MTYIVSPQAKIASVGYAMVLASMVVTALYTRSISPKFLIGFFMYVLVCGLSLYVINCTVTGMCIIYAWIVGWIVVVLGISTVLTAMLSVFRK